LAPLRPVQSNAWEAGLRAAPLDALLLTFDVYRIGLTDDIYSVTAPGTTQIFFQNVGATRREGVEASAQVDLQVVEIEAGYAYTHATFRNDLTLATPRTEEGVQEVHAGATMPLVPAHRLNVTLRVRPTSWLSLSVGATYVGSQVFRGDEANVAPRLDPYLVSRAGAEARWRWHGHWTASFRAVNLFDTKYETFGTYATNGRAPGQPIEPFLTPGAPLRLVAGVRWELGG
jgi:outer membrane receptor protein involved in Fe transport